MAYYHLEIKLENKNMRFNILSDSNYEAKIDSVLDYLSEKKYRQYFSERNYGSDFLENITIILMCRSSELAFKQRIRLSKKDKVLYLDLMLDNDIFTQIEQTERNRIVKEKILFEVVPIISKYKFKDFNIIDFEKDLKKIFK